ncbi:MAG TPA: hydroxyacid dehydrogenase [Candidatus Caldiarchaeum subterraneum]|uniref:Hydroxyacid dehydrogenase n=1 Tax=Caldiarchaeum subterraneum TaxID=311458 RepID=A0A833ECF7_CALS0|nr:hydroxyacid dehydrogenase [Candidatus Caldarchaeum subterraneum]
MTGGKSVVLTYVDLTDEARRTLEPYAEVYDGRRDDLGDILPLVEVIICFKLDVNHLSKMKNLRLIQSVAAGVDALPWDRIPDDVIVCSNAGSNDSAVAEHAWAFILSLVKNLHIHTRNMKENRYTPTVGVGLIEGRTIGIIGLGAIGRRIAEIAKAFRMRVLAVTRSGKSSFECDFIGGPESIDKVLEESDVVVVATPLTKHTRNMINKEKLRKMKKNAILVNIARAAVIHREDLLEFLRENPEFRLASDVWWNTNERFHEDYEFMKFPNVLGTPWIAGGLGNDEVWRNMVNKAAENVARFLKGEKPLNIVYKSDYV